jgi:SSS family solute:Na+ symporter
MFWRRATGHGAFTGLLTGTGVAALTHGLTVAEDKGGWIAPLHQFPSTMAQNFYIAIFAWTSCFLVTVLVSLLTKPRPPEQLRGLVYGLTEVPHDDGVSWYLKPASVAVLVIAVLLALNIWFR